MKQIVLISLLFTYTLFADFKAGDRLPDITLSDQFDKSYKVEKEDSLVIMAFEKNVSGEVNDYLKTKNESFLPTHHTKYISDISTMPSFITSMFALPKMKKYPFSMMLIRNDFGKQFNRTKGKVTVYRLKNHKILDIQFIDPEAIATLFSKK